VQSRNLRKEEFPPNANAQRTGMQRNCRNGFNATDVTDARTALIYHCVLAAASAALVAYLSCVYYLRQGGNVFAGFCLSVCVWAR